MFHIYLYVATKARGMLKGTKVISFSDFQGPLSQKIIQM